MTSSVTFVIPVLNEAHGIAPLLRGLRERYPDAELVVVDGGSQDHTRSAARAHCDLLLSSDPGRAQQMNLGAQQAHGDYVFFLHADTMPGVSASELTQYLQRQPQWGFSRVCLSGSQRAFRVIEWFINGRSALTNIATGDQMLFVQRDLFQSMGGYDAIPLMEDVALCKRLRAGSPPCLLTQPVQTSSRRWEQRGIVRTVLQMWWLRLAYRCGVPPQRLWQSYYGG